MQKVLCDWGRHIHRNLVSPCSQEKHLINRRSTPIHAAIIISDLKYYNTEKQRQENLKKNTGVKKLEKVGVEEIYFKND